METDLVISNVYLPEIGRESFLAKADNRLVNIAIKDGVIADLSDQPITAKRHIDGGGRYLTPGLIDCHTHLVYGGHRADEFELKLNGVSYEEISRQGGGIKSTVNATRCLDEDALFNVSHGRLEKLLAEGVTTVEIKSGYGLDLDNEMKMLRVARRLGDALPVSVKTTFLGAHACPNEFSEADDYIDHVVNIVLPRIAAEKLADAVDFFCESIAFTPAQCEKICIAASNHNLPIKGHVEQLSNLGGAKLVAKYQGLSVDHLEHLTETDIPLLKQAGLVAVLLPGAFYSLRETKLPPIEAMIEHQLDIAVASDLNPGSSPIASLLSVMNMAAIKFKLSPQTILKGVTLNAAKALGIADQYGSIEVGKASDLVLWDIDTPAQLCYGMNLVSPSAVIKNGIEVTK